ncbi:hypothetical protein [Ilumatobacter sp.]|uniref:hypothetical protein n=1 Tax=Ilumatobacter sp. TaxID=1967498 RepID=UPI003AF5ABC3
MMEYLIVAVCGFVFGGWAVPLGFVLGLGPVATFAASAAGGLIGCWLFLLAGDRIAEWTSRRRAGPEAASVSDEPDDVSSDEAEVGRVRRFVDRYGVRGLGLVGPIFPGVTASVVGGLALGLDRRALGRWLSVGIVVMYAIYVAGVAVLVRAFS